MTRRTSADGRALRARVQKAIAYLHGIGESDHAEAVAEFVTAHRRTDVPDNPNLAFKVHPAAWAEAQWAEGGASAVAAEGIRLFLAGEFRPEKPRRVAGGRTQGNTRVTREVREQVTKYAAQHADTLGWTPSVAQVAAAWIEQRFLPRT